MTSEQQDNGQLSEAIEPFALFLFVSVLPLPGPSDPERGEFSLGRFALGGPTSSRLSAILVAGLNGWSGEMMRWEMENQSRHDSLRDVSKLATFIRAFNV